MINKEYKNTRTKLILKDNKGYYYISLLGRLYINNLPRKFHTSNPYTIENIKLWCKLNDKPFELLDGQEYKGNKKKLKWKCLKEDCGETFEANLNNIFNWGCGYCAGQKVGLSNCLATKNPELAKQWHPTKNNNLTPYNFTYGSHKEVWWLCLECGHEWEASIKSRSLLNAGCPQCNESKGEIRIREWLKSNNIKYNIQKEFDGLVGLGGGLLYYDFYLSSNNLLIEYDGEFHYKLIKKYKSEPIKYAEERLKYQKAHDKLKDEYAKKHNIKLLRIPYWDFDNIEKILEKENPY